MPGRSSGDLERLGSFIRERRIELGLTQTQLAQRIDWVQERISTLENGRYGLPSLPTLARLAEGLQVPLSALLAACGYEDTLGIAGEQSEETEASRAILLYTLQQLFSIEAVAFRDALMEASDRIATAVAAEKIDAFIYEAASGSLVALGTSNTPMGRQQHAAGLDRLPVANRDPAVVVYETGEPYLNGHVDQDPTITPGIREVLGVKSMLAVPLTVGGERRGVLSAQSGEPNRFSEDDLRFLEIVSNWVGMVAHRAELTEERARDAALQARRLAAEEIVTLLAHDLGNHLTPLKGRIDICRRRADRDGREHDVGDLDEALRALGRTQQMVTELLDITRLDQGVFSVAREEVDLVPLIAEVAGEFGDEASPITIRTPDELIALVDPGRVCQILENLLSNALRHSPEGTPVMIEASPEARRDGIWARVSVRDEGPGIPPEILPELFQRFVSGPGSRGLGLGLFAARSMAEAHGGSLTVQSEPGTGSTFILSLPDAR